MKLLFVSTNAHKIEEIKRQLPAGWILQGMSDLGLSADIPETSDTIAGNSKLKAEEGFARSGISCFAEDSGLEVEALNGAPGVHSARYSGEGADGNIQKLLEELRDVENRKARFITVITFTDGTDFHQFTGVCEGTISAERLGSGGFGYDPVFIPLGESLSFGQMDAQGKDAFSHRRKAVEKLLTFLKDKFGEDRALH
jgi:XTP/dITP diphosphohydrolase